MSITQDNFDNSRRAVFTQGPASRSWVYYLYEIRTEMRRRKKNISLFADFVKNWFGNVSPTNLQVAMTYSVELFLCMVLGLAIGHAIFNSSSPVRHKSPQSHTIPWPQLVYLLHCGTGDYVPTILCTQNQCVTVEYRYPPLMYGWYGTIPVLYRK